MIVKIRQLRTMKKRYRLYALIECLAPWRFPHPFPDEWLEGAR